VGICASMLAGCMKTRSSFSLKARVGFFLVEVCKFDGKEVSKNVKKNYKM
jgi:hypothetical protein